MSPPWAEEPAAVSVRSGLLGLVAAAALLPTLYGIGRAANWLHLHVAVLAVRPRLAAGVAVGGAGLVVALAWHLWSRIRARRVSTSPSDSRPTDRPKADPPAADGRPTLRPPGARLCSWPAALEWSFYAAVVAVMFWPVSSDPFRYSAGSGDAVYFIWQGWRLAEAIKAGNLVPWQIADVVYPYGSNLLLTDGTLPGAVGALWNLVAPPILAYNLAMVTATLLNLGSARYLARHFTRSRAVAAMVAVAFATAPAVSLRNYGHFTFYFAFSAPLLVAEGIRIARTGRVRLWRLTALLFLAYLCSIYFLVFGGIALALIALTALPSWRARLTVARQMTAAVLATGLLMLPFIIPRIRLDRAELAAGGAPVLEADAVAHAADAYSLVAQPVTSTFDLPWNSGLRDTFGSNVVEATIFPGYLLLLGAVGILCLRSRWRWPLSAGALGVWLFTLGPSLEVDGRYTHALYDGTPVGWLPFQLLLEVPGLGSLRAPNRASFVLAAILAAASALALDALFGRLRSSRQLVAGLGCAALLITNLQVPINYGELAWSDALEQALLEVADRGDPDDAVVLVPADCIETASVSLQILHRQPMVGCYANSASLAWYSGLDVYMGRSMAALRCQPSWMGRRFPLPYEPQLPLLHEDLEAVHRRLGVRFILLDKTMISRDMWCAGGRIDRVEEQLLQWFEVIGGDDTMVVLDIERGRAPVGLIPDVPYR